MKKNVEVLLQKEVTECGHVSLLMILSYFGHYMDLGTYRDKYFISPDGSTFFDLIKQSEKFGLRAEAYEIKQKDLDEVKTPAIWQIYGAHFVVIEKVDKKNIYIVDPACGKRTISRNSLFNYVSADGLCYVLEFEETDNFKIVDNRINIGIYNIIQNIKGIHTYFIQIFLFAFLTQGIILLTPLYIQFAMDRVIGNNDTDMLALMTIGFIFVFLIDILVKYNKEYLSITLEKSLIEKLSRQIFQKLLKAPLSYIENRVPAVIENQYEALEKIIQLISRVIVGISIDIVMIISLIIVMLILNIKLALVVICIVSLYGGIRYVFYKKNLELSADFWEKKGEEKSTLLESIKNMKTIKLFNLEEDRYRLYTKKILKRTEVGGKLYNLSNLFSVSGNGLNHLDTLVIIYIGTLLVLKDYLTIGMLYSFIFYKNIFVMSIISFLDKYSEAKIIKSEIEYIKDILVLQPEIEENNQNKLTNSDNLFYNLNGKIEFKNFDFSYEKSENFIFKKFNFLLNDNESLCIVGKSGSGKTTLLNTLVRLYPINKGQVFVSGIDITQIPIDFLRQNISYMIPEEEFFNASIIEHITLKEKNPNIEKIIDILKGIQLYEYIVNKVSGGLHNNIQNIQYKFSAGQKQRLLLARVLYKNSELLLLDEPTSSLDMETEKKVMEYLMSLDRRMIIITHRKEVSNYFNNVLSI